MLIQVAIGFSSLITKLDTTASDVVAQQKESLLQRKELAQKTRDFKKLDDAKKLLEHKGLIKGKEEVYAGCLVQS